MVKSARKLIGATNPLEAEAGTIRGDLAVQTGRNVVHGSDSPENGERETGKGEAMRGTMADASTAFLQVGSPLTYRLRRLGVDAALWFGDKNLEQWEPSSKPWLYE